MVVELVEGVWWLELRGVNAYLVDDDVLTLVDAGTRWDAAKIRSDIREAGFTVGDIGRVLLTHYDLDHAGGLTRLTPELEASVSLGAADADLLKGTRRPSVRNRKGIFQRASQPFIGHPELPIAALADGESVGSFTAFHTPGHTAGHTVYISTDLEVAMLGDLVRSNGSELAPVPWFLSQDMGRLDDSIRRLVDRAPPFEMACTGHGRPLRAGGRAALETLAASR